MKKGNVQVGLTSRFSNKPVIAKGQVQVGIQRKRSRSEVGAPEAPEASAKPRVLFPERLNLKRPTLDINPDTLPTCSDHPSLLEVTDGCLEEMHFLEQDYAPDPDYLVRQPQLNPRMRAVLLDWMFEVGQEYGLKRDTLHFAINFVDRYLSRQENPVPRQELQLVGVTALWIASKMEEILPPPVSDFAAATDGGCSAQQIIEMEGRMVQALDWKLLPCTAFAFANYYLQRIALDINRKEIVRRKEEFTLENRSWMYQNIVSAPQLIRIMEILDLALLDVDSLCFNPSMLAATAILSIVEKSKSDVLTVDHVLKVTSFEYDDLRDCLEWFSFAPELPPASRDFIYRPHIIESNLETELHLIQRHNSTAIKFYKDVVAKRQNARHPSAERSLQRGRLSMNASEESDEELERINMHMNKRHSFVMNLDPARSYSPMTQIAMTLERTSFENGFRAVSYVTSPQQ